MSSGAVFTMRLKDVFATQGGTWDSSNGISVLTGNGIGLDLYPLFSDEKVRTGNGAIPDYRPILNGKIFDHFMNREIGYESIGIWHLAMRRKMNEIMPFYNQYYLSTLIVIVPIQTTDLATANTMNDTQIANQTATNTSASNAAASARSVNSETPQTMLQSDEDYASGATDSNSQNTTNGTGNQVNNSTTTDNAVGTTTITGYQGLASDLLIRYRDSFINVDMMIINELEELFMQIWDNGDAFTNTNNNDWVSTW
jgi:hypothetical protein